jgi:hypothetical protein
MDPTLRNVLTGGAITALLTLLAMIENRRRSRRRAELDRRELARAHAEDGAAMRADADAYAVLAPECVYYYISRRELEGWLASASGT